MSEGFPGGADFFGRIPLFREFARLLASGDGPVNWELARQVALATAAGAEDVSGLPALPTPNARPIDPAERQRWDEQLRLAELWLDPATTLPGGGVALSSRPRTRPDWAEDALKLLPKLVEPMAKRLASALAAGAGQQEAAQAAGTPMPAEMSGMLGRVGGLMFGIQIGSVVGQLARSVSGHYDLVLPTGARTHVTVLPENADALVQATGLPGDQVRLWIAARLLARQRVIEGVGWLPEHLTGLLEQAAASIDPDASGLVERLQSLDPGRPESLQEILEGSDLLGAGESPATRETLGKVEALLAVVTGYGSVVAHNALAGRLPKLDEIEAAAARLEEAEEGGPALFAGLLQADPDRAAGRRGVAFCREVLAATDMEGLDRVWAHATFLPSPEELDAPGRWLERMGLIGGESIDLDEGLRQLLDEEQGRGPDDRGDDPGPTA